MVLVVLIGNVIRLHVISMPNALLLVNPHTYVNAKMDGLVMATSVMKLMVVRCMTILMRNPVVIMRYVYVMDPLNIDVTVNPVTIWLLILRTVSQQIHVIRIPVRIRLIVYRRDLINRVYINVIVGMVMLVMEKPVNVERN
jgi:hypothetical protein